MATHTVIAIVRCVIKVQPTSLTEVPLADSTWTSHTRHKSSPCAAHMFIVCRLAHFDPARFRSVLVTVRLPSAPTMYVAPHQQAIAPWAAPVAAAAAAPPGLAQQFQPTPNGGGGRSSPPPGVITRRPKIDKMTGRTGEEILVCWLTPAPPNPFGHKFRA